MINPKKYKYSVVAPSDMELRDPQYGEDGKLISKGHQLQRKYSKIRNNEACPCDSGKKFKNCCK